MEKTDKFNLAISIMQELDDIKSIIDFEVMNVKDLVSMYEDIIDVRKNMHKKHYKENISIF